MDTLKIQIFVVMKTENISVALMGNQFIFLLAFLFWEKV
ncbi:hypothetical protein SAMN05421857_2999 [Chryseobacterium formosense]|nr:hypothetical protein SAMN05421857_2999 [Chryseobacterium formosense]